MSDRLRFTPLAFADRGLWRRVTMTSVSAPRDGSRRAAPSGRSDALDAYSGARAEFAGHAVAVPNNANTGAERAAPKK
jgi:hypothetical protein